MPMTDQQQLFVDLYFLHNGNATKAAEAAGYSHPNVQGTQVKQSPAVAAEIKRRLDEHAMPANEVLSRLADHARGSLEDFLDIADSGFASLNLSKAKAAGKMPLLKTWEYDRRTGVKIALHDAQAALVQIGKHHKLFTERHEHDFSKLTDEELLAAIQGEIGGGEASGTDAGAD